MMLGGYVIALGKQSIENAFDWELFWFFGLRCSLVMVKVCWWALWEWWSISVLSTSGTVKEPAFIFVPLQNFCLNGKVKYSLESHWVTFRSIWNKLFQILVLPSPSNVFNISLVLRNSYLFVIFLLRRWQFLNDGERKSENTTCRELCPSVSSYKSCKFSDVSFFDGRCAHIGKKKDEKSSVAFLGKKTQSLNTAGDHSIPKSFCCCICHY